MYCDWARRGAFGCLAPEAASGVKNILSEEALSDKFFQVLPEASAVGGLVSLTVMVRAMSLCSRKCKVVLDRHQCLIYG